MGISIMERESVKKLLMTMAVTFNNFKIADDNLSFTINAWHEILKDYEEEDITMAYKTYIATNNSGFAPSVSQLIGFINMPAELAAANVSEAWAKVRVAIGKSAYNSLEEYNKLDPAIQKAVGSAQQLYYWAIDDNFNDSVVMSIFAKNYQAILKRESDERKLPIEARQRLEKIRKDNITLMNNNAFLIGQKVDKLQEGDFDYEEPPRPDEETIGYYAQQLREKLGVD